MLPKSWMVWAMLSIPLFGALWMEGRRAERYSLGTDLRRGQQYLKIIDEGEKRCFQFTGSYVNLPFLGPKGCGGVRGELSNGVHDDFRFDVYGTGATYSVSVYPANSTRLVSLYSDQSRKVRIGTRQRPATSVSPLLNDDTPKK